MGLVDVTKLNASIDKLKTDTATLIGQHNDPSAQDAVDAAQAAVDAIDVAVVKAIAPAAPTA